MPPDPKAKLPSLSLIYVGLPSELSPVTLTVYLELISLLFIDIRNMDLSESKAVE